MPTFYLNTFAILSIKLCFRKKEKKLKREDGDYGSKSDSFAFSWHQNKVLNFPPPLDCPTAPPPAESCTMRTNDKQVSVSGFSKTMGS